MRRSAWQELFRPELAAFTIILNLGIGLHAVDVFVISTVMPTVVRDIGGASFYAWSTMLYMVASIVGAASGGPLKAALGPRKGYALGGLMFLAGSAACGASPVMAVLLIARTVQGYGGGLLLAQSMGLISELYPPSLRTRILATVSGVWGVAALVGPLVGGVFAEFGWWRGAFWASTPIILWFTARAWQTLPRVTAATDVPPFPVRRIGLLALGVLCAGAADQVQVLAADFLPAVAANALLLMGLQGLLLIAALVLTIQAFRRDAAATNRLFPPRPLSLTPIGTGYWIMFLFSMTHTSIGIYLPLALQELHGVTPLAAGYANAALAVSWTVASFVTAGWRGSAEAAAIIGGPLIALLAVIGLALGVTTLSPLLTCVLTGLIGFGIGGCNLHLVAQTMRIAEPGFESLTASSIPTIRSLGIAFGAAIAGLIANSAGLADGVSVQSVAAAARWVYGATILAPGVSLLLALRVIQLRRATAELPRELR